MTIRSSTSMSKKNDWCDWLFRVSEDLNTNTKNSRFVHCRHARMTDCAKLKKHHLNVGVIHWIFHRIFCEHERLRWSYERFNPSNSRILNSRPISIVSPTQFQKDHKPSHRFVTMVSFRPLGGVVLFQIASVASRWGVILTTYSLGWSEGFHPTHLSATSQPALHRYLHRRKKENAMSFRVAQRRSLIEGSELH